MRSDTDAFLPEPESRPKRHCSRYLAVGEARRIGSGNDWLVARYAGAMDRVLRPRESDGPPATVPARGRHAGPDVVGLVLAWSVMLPRTTPRAAAGLAGRQLSGALRRAASSPARRTVGRTSAARLRSEGTTAWEPDGRSSGLFGPAALLEPCPHEAAHVPPVRHELPRRGIQTAWPGASNHEDMIEGGMRAIEPAGDLSCPDIESATPSRSRARRLPPGTTAEVDHGRADARPVEDRVAVSRPWLIRSTTVGCAAGTWTSAQTASCRATRSRALRSSRSPSGVGSHGELFG